ncbi:hypothetical protein PG996_010832 [Apiospora saccharicola]|uniref:Uncharacterized protein n=1 Tax=Apiospora saccharicola TaxID=335842 RepID=A0ABR1UPQ3_9PEZI
MPRQDLSPSVTGHVQSPPANQQQYLHAPSTITNPTVASSAAGSGDYQKPVHGLAKGHRSATWSLPSVFSFNCFKGKGKIDPKAESKGLLTEEQKVSKRRYNWRSEFLLGLIAILSSLAIILLMVFADGNPLGSFKIPLPLVIAGLGATTRGSLAFAIGACLAQGKWNWLRQRSDNVMSFKKFDEASRGPMGALHLATLGALVTALLLAFDPLLQGAISHIGQLVDTPNLAAPTIPYGSRLDARQGGRPNTSSQALINWIQNLKGDHFHDWLSNLCYGARGEKGEQSLIVAQRTTADDCFVDLAHYIGRLGAHAFAVKTIVHAALTLPNIIKFITEVRYEMRHEDFLPPQAIKVDLGLAGPYEMVRDILEKCDLHLSEKLQILQDFVKIDLERDITRLYRSDGTNTISIKPFVHAELQLCDLANREDMQFVDNDRYVGCSKPACYFCLRYMNSHPTKRFVEPTSHHKVPLGVRAPAADPSRDVNGNGAAILRDAQHNMEWKVEQDILGALGSTSDPISFQHLSTDGVDRESSVITTRFGY